MTPEDHIAQGEILAAILSENMGNRITTATGNGMLGQFMESTRKFIIPEKAQDAPKE